MTTTESSHPLAEGEASSPAENTLRPRRLSGLTIAYATAFSFGLAWTTRLMLASPGVPVQDEIGHVLIAKEAWHRPDYLLDPWGRAGNTLAYFVGSHWGLNGARATSLVFAAATVLISTLVARKLGLRFLFLVPVLLWFQPWFNDFSYAAITEVPFSLALIAGVALALKDRTGWASLSFGLLPLIRHEGIVLLGGWALVALYRRRWRDLALTAAPYFAFEISNALVYQRFAFADIYLNSRPTTFYGSGDWGHFFSPLWDGVGWIVLLLAAFAIPRLVSLSGRAIVFLPYVLYFLTHTVLFRFGLFASGGYGLFLLPLAPGFAIASALGLQWLAERTRVAGASRATAARATGTTLLAVAVVGALWLGLQTDPRPLDRDGVAMKEVASWLSERGVPTDQVLTVNPWLNLFYEVPFRPGPPAHWRGPDNLRRMPLGTILVWDKHYSDRLGWPRDHLDDPANGWTLLQAFHRNLAVIFVKSRA